MAQAYYDYSTLVILSTMAAVGSAVYETRKVLISNQLCNHYQQYFVPQQMYGLRKTSHVAGSVTVIRGGVEKRILSQNLVPGDILCINPHDEKIPFHCDAVLIEGTCSVDESMLTGESKPITKVIFAILTSQPFLNIMLYRFQYLTTTNHSITISTTATYYTMELGYCKGGHNRTIITSKPLSFAPVLIAQTPCIKRSNRFVCL